MLLEPLHHLEVLLPSAQAPVVRLLQSPAQMSWVGGQKTLLKGYVALNFQPHCLRNHLSYKGRNNSSQSVPAAGRETFSISFYTQRQLS